MEEDVVDKMKVVRRGDAANKIIRTRWVLANEGSDDRPQLCAMRVAEEFRGQGGDRHEYFSDTLDSALVKALVAHAAWLAALCDTAAAVFFVRRAHFHAEEKRNTFVELLDFVLADMRGLQVVDKRRWCRRAWRWSARMLVEKAHVRCGRVNCFQQ